MVIAKKYEVLLVMLILGLALTACENINRRSSIPYAPVDYIVNITREYPHFVVENGPNHIIVTQKKLSTEFIGYAGLLIWVGMDNAYHAADLCCPYCVKKNKPLEVDGMYAVCKLCGEHYDISWGFGYPTKGITDEPLKQYNTSLIIGAAEKKLRILN